MSAETTVADSTCPLGISVEHRGYTKDLVHGESSRLLLLERGIEGRSGGNKRSEDALKCN